MTAADIIVALAAVGTVVAVAAWRIKVRIDARERAKRGECTGCCDGCDCCCGRKKH